jgi:hypothetical protein
MAQFCLGGDGPNFSLIVRDVENLRENGSLDITNGQLSARVSLVDYDPNAKTFPNGYVGQYDMECGSGIRMRRFPERISPYDYKSRQRYILRIQREFFEEIVEAGKIEEDKTGFIHPRCKYDRFALLIHTDF